LLAQPRGGCLNRPREPLPTSVEGLPDLPAAFWRVVDDGLVALGLTLGAEARLAIDGHARLLIAWSAAINLTSVRDPLEIARRHVLDSLTAAGPMRDWRTTELLDLGSGGGYPGLTLAAAVPADRAVLVESIGKKAAFLSVAANATGLAPRVAVAADRAEALAAADHREAWPVVTARAVGSTAELIELAFPLLERHGRLVAWKRDPSREELAAGRRAAVGLGGGRLEILAPPGATAAGLEGHVLVIATKTGRTASGWPRAPAERRREPW
jgi:16S rRNA (guanine527-N7)-methyltransferase